MCGNEPLVSCDLITRDPINISSGFAHSATCLPKHKVRLLWLTNIFQKCDVRQTHINIDLDFAFLKGRYKSRTRSTQITDLNKDTTIVICLTLE